MKQSSKIFLVLILLFSASAVLAYFFSNGESRPSPMPDVPDVDEVLDERNAEDAENLFTQTFTSDLLPYAVSYDSNDPLVDESFQEPLGEDSTVDERSVASAGVLYTASFRGTNMSVTAVSDSFEPVALGERDFYVKDFSIDNEYVMSMDVVGETESVVVDIENTFTTPTHHIYFFAQHSTGTTNTPRAVVKLLEETNGITVLSFANDDRKELEGYLKTLTLR